MARKLEQQCDTAWEFVRSGLKRELWHGGAASSLGCYVVVSIGSLHFLHTRTGLPSITRRAARVFFSHLAQ